VVYQPDGVQLDTPASKRAELDKYASLLYLCVLSSYFLQHSLSHGNVEEKMSIFIFLTEVLGTKELLDLRSQFLGTLSKTIHYDSLIPFDNELSLPKSKGCCGTSSGKNDNI
jgi:hypothetical protein